LFDEKVEVHDHDTPGQRIETTRQDAQLYRLREGIVVETDYYNDREQALKAVGPGE